MSWTNTTYFRIHAQSHAQFWLLICIHPQFRAKKDLFRMNAQFRANLVSYWYENDARFREKSNFAQKRKTVPQESLLFRGNPSLTERGKRSEYAKNVKEIE